ncbi:MAG: hypothetical protein LBT40_12570 [Deltaproteobacteria bacterium]|jgi:tracheal colonization factor|nr:hypothetical protein [Deltaproteobacteria bacterium]
MTATCGRLTLAAALAASLIIVVGTAGPVRAQPAPRDGGGFLFSAPSGTGDGPNSGPDVRAPGSGWGRGGSGGSDVPGTGGGRGGYGGKGTADDGGRSADAAPRRQLRSNDEIYGTRPPKGGGGDAGRKAPRGGDGGWGRPAPRGGDEETADAAPRGRSPRDDDDNEGYGLPDPRVNGKTPPAFRVPGPRGDDGGRDGGQGRPETPGDPSSPGPGPGGEGFSLPGPGRGQHRGAWASLEGVTPGSPASFLG